MPYQIDWYIESRVIYARVWGSISLDTIHSASEDLIQFLDAGKPLVHLFLDDSEVTVFPSNFYAVKKSATFITHPNLGWAVTIGETNFVRQFILPMVTSIAGVRYRRFKTFTEGHMFLKGQDQTIDWVSADENVLVG